MLVVRADGFVDPCIPSLAHKPPSGRDWVHEVKHVGYGLIVRREAIVALQRRRVRRAPSARPRHRCHPTGLRLAELDGEDLRPLPLGKRKERLARLLARVRVTDENGAVVFLHACKMGLEGIVSKRLTAPYRFGPFRDWLKVKNPDSPAMIRAREHFARLRDGVDRATLYRLRAEASPDIKNS